MVHHRHACLQIQSGLQEGCADLVSRVVCHRVNADDVSGGRRVVAVDLNRGAVRVGGGVQGVRGIRQVVDRTLVRRDA